MLNRPDNAYRERDVLDAPADRPWQVDARPATRLVWLFVLMSVPPLCVVGRLVQLQQRLAGTIVPTSGQTRETFESIPSRDGRILGTDGRVLARDVARFEVLVNYRWVEMPADPVWLRRQALGRLSPTERTDAERVADAEQAVRAEREAMWERLARLTGRDLAELVEHRAAIQRRVERMVASVEERRNRRLDAGRQETPVDRSAAPLWQRAWRTVVAALTTSAERDAAEPLVLPEQSADYPLLDDVTLDMAAEIESHPERFPGLSTRISSWREYPHGELAAHVIGVRRPNTDEEWADREPRLPAGDPLDHPAGVRSGQTGVERTYDRYLRGITGLRRTVRNRRGEIVATEIVRPPRPGRDVVLTLDLDLQQRMEQLLDRILAEQHGDLPRRTDFQSVRSADGCIVALDVRTGAVLTAASAPRFDLRIAAAPDAESWRAILDDPRRPLFHRAIAMTLPPGSTFKTLTAVAVLESSRMDPDEKIFCQGYLDRPDRYRCYVYRHFGHGHGETDLNDALARSCNVYFFQAARTIGPEPIVDWAGRFGFGQPSGIDLPGEAAGNVPHPPEDDSMLVVTGFSRSLPSQALSARGSPVTGSSRSLRPWYSGDALGLAIGQSRLTVTPLQVARMMAVIANGGRLVTPHVVRGFGPALTVADEAAGLPSPAQPQHIAGLRAGTLERLREGLERVVAHPTGTGYKHVRLQEVAIAGKTGTAEVGGGREDHAWFAGYVPADRPKIAFAVVLEHGGSGGAVAGTVARELVRVMLEIGLLE